MDGVSWSASVAQESFSRSRTPAETLSKLASFIARAENKQARHQQPQPPPQQQQQQQQQSSHLPPYVCQECGSGFSYTTDLLHHQDAKHSLPKPHRCPLCGQEFSLRSSLLLHKCEQGATLGSLCHGHLHLSSQCRSQCATAAPGSTDPAAKLPESASQQPPLLDGTPYACAPCGRGFSHKQALLQHQQAACGEPPSPSHTVHTSCLPGDSPPPSEGDSDSSDAAASPGGGAVCVCKLCSRSFGSRSRLRRHRETSHTSTREPSQTSTREPRDLRETSIRKTSHTSTREPKELRETSIRETRDLRETSTRKTSHTSTRETSHTSTRETRDLRETSTRKTSHTSTRETRDLSETSTRETSHTSARETRDLRETSTRETIQPSTRELGETSETGTREFRETSMRKPREFKENSTRETSHTSTREPGETSTRDRRLQETLAGKSRVDGAAGDTEERRRAKCEQKKVLKCRSCDLVCRSVSQLGLHRKEKHSRESSCVREVRGVAARTRRKGTYPCQLCGKILFHHLSLKAHYRQHTAEASRGQCSAPSSSLAERRTKKVQSSLARSKTFRAGPGRPRRRGTRLEEEQEEQQEEEEEEEEECDEVPEIEEEEEEEEEQEFPCPSCTQVFPLRWQLQEHEELHQSCVRRSRCSVCSCEMDSGRWAGGRRPRRLYHCVPCQQGFAQLHCFLEHCQEHLRLRVEEDTRASKAQDQQPPE